MGTIYWFFNIVYNTTIPDNSLVHSMYCHCRRRRCLGFAGRCVCAWDPGRPGHKTDGPVLHRCGLHQIWTGKNESFPVFVMNRTVAACFLSGHSSVQNRKKYKPNGVYIAGTTERAYLIFVCFSIWLRMKESESERKKEKRKKSETWKCLKPIVYFEQLLFFLPIRGYPIQVIDYLLVYRSFSLSEGEI